MQFTGIQTQVDNVKLKKKRSIAMMRQKIEPPLETSDEYDILPMAYYEITLLNRSIFLNPPIEHIRQLWYDQFQEFTTHITILDRISSARFELSAENNSRLKETFADLV